MKTTVDLPDELLTRARKRAAEERRSLRSLIEEGLKLVLESPKGQRKIHWVTVEGGLPPDLDAADRARMQEWIRGRR